MAEHAPCLPGLSPVAGEPVHVAFDGGRLTSDAGVLLLAEIERRLGIAERLARCLADPRDPERTRHTLAEMIRLRALLIAAGYPDGNDCDALRSDPAFKMAVGRLPESGAELCSQPSFSRLENLPGATALERMMAAMAELFCDSFQQVPKRIVPSGRRSRTRGCSTSTTPAGAAAEAPPPKEPAPGGTGGDRVHGHQQLSLFQAHGARPAAAFGRPEGPAAAFCRSTSTRL
jgi:hypothetical protein